jgi:acyl-CoA dehydrogenase
LDHASGDAGLLGLSMPEEDGGMGGDYRHEVVLMRQLGWKGADHFGISLHNAIVAPYIWHYGTELTRSALAAAAADGRTGRRHRHDRAGRRVSDLQGIKTTAIKTATSMW